MKLKDSITNDNKRLKHLSCNIDIELDEAIWLNKDGTTRNRSLYLPIIRNIRHKQLIQNEITVCLFQELLNISRNNQVFDNIPIMTPNAINRMLYNNED